MDIFIGQLVGFALIVFLLWRYVAPPVRKLMSNRQQAVRTQLEDSATAKDRLTESKSAHQKAVKDAEAEAKQVTDEARADAASISEQLRVQADAEVARVKVQGQQHIQLLRAQLIRQLRQDLGAESVRRAGDMVRDHVSDSDAQSATVDRFLDDLDAMAPSDITVADPSTATLGAASRASLASLVERFDEVAADLDEHALSTLAADLTAVITLLTREAILTRHLADPSSDEEPRVRLLESVLGGKVGDPALDVLKAAVAGRWLSGSNLLDAIEHAARLSLMVAAEHGGHADDVEEQLFWFGRILDTQPQLSTLLSDYTRPTQGRVELLNNVLAGNSGIDPTTSALLAQTIELLRGGRADEAVHVLAQLAVARHGEVVAHVRAAAELSDAQLTRLTEVLSRIYNHPVSVQPQVDARLLGGLAISIGDEVIDGTLSSRLATAQNQLPD